MKQPVLQQPEMFSIYPLRFELPIRRRSGGKHSMEINQNDIPTKSSDARLAVATLMMVLSADLLGLSPLKVL